MHTHLLNAGLAIFFLVIFYVGCGTFSRHCQRKAAHLPRNDQALALAAVYPIEGVIMVLVLLAFGLSMKFFANSEITQSQQAVGAFFVLAAGCITLMFWLNSYYAKKYHTIWADPSFNWW